MSIIFGICRPVIQTVERAELLSLASATQRFATDGTFVQVSQNIGMGFQPYHTHERSRLEVQPASDQRGNLLVLDGRLDNYAELSTLLGIGDINTPDSTLVLAAYARWGTQCFSRFIGDWAMALWSAKDRITYLARDHAGTRALYFQNTNGTLRWATYLETFTANGERYPLAEQYAACFLCAQPIHDFTPYEGIRAVPPAHFIAFSDISVTTTAHWSSVARGQIRYTSDAEYEEHFLALFEQSVVRRTGNGAPILAELSGGMDSTSIVCISDRLRRAQGAGSRDLLDTLSYYDPSEPNWNEESYFSITEARRGKSGIHIETPTATRTFRPVEISLSYPRTSLWPGLDYATLEQEKSLHGSIEGRGFRVVLSGLGGDELLGGVPEPLPELADCLVKCQFRRLSRQSIKWCLASRTTLIHLLLQTLKFTATLYWGSQYATADLPPWVQPRLRLRCSKAQQEFGALADRVTSTPSRISSSIAWLSILETMPHARPNHLSRHEVRYPYLDRDLADYLLQVPREQLVRPGRRRSLMRRALKEIVPIEILEPVHDLLSSNTRKARWRNCKLELSFLSQFFHKRRHFSSQAKDLSTTHRLGNTTKACNSLRFTTCTLAPKRCFTPSANG